jgi:iron complex transport system substrate-binding protein
MQALTLLEGLKKLLQLDSLTPSHPAYASIIQQLNQLQSPSQILHAVESIGHELGAEAIAQAWVEDQEERLQILSHKVKFIDAQFRPKVWYLTDFETSTTVLPYWEEIITLAGGLPLPNQKDSSPLLADHLFVISHLPEVAIWSTLPHWIESQGLQGSEAIRQNQVLILPKEAQWPLSGWDIASQTEHLAECLYPSFFAFGPPSPPWIPFEFA